MYYHFNAWSKQGAWKKLWRTSLHLHRRALDLSSVQLDGSHSLAKNGGAAIGYQGRGAKRAARPTPCSWLTTRACHWPWPRPRPATSTTRLNWNASLPSCANCSKPLNYAWKVFFSMPTKSLMSPPYGKRVRGAVSRPTSHATDARPTDRPTTTRR